MAFHKPRIVYLQYFIVDPEMLCKMNKIGHGRVNYVFSRWNVCVKVIRIKLKSVFLRML